MTNGRWLGVGVVVLTALMMARTSAAQVYRYVDEEGNVHFTDQPHAVPEGAEVERSEGRRSTSENGPKVKGLSGLESARELEGAAREAEADGDLERAAEAYSAALALHQKNGSSRLAEKHYHLADLLTRHGRVDEALLHLRTAAEQRTREYGTEDAASTLYVRKYLSALRALGRADEAAEVEQGLLRGPTIDDESEEGNKKAAESKSDSEAKSDSDADEKASEAPTEDPAALLEKLRESGLAQP